MSVPLLAEETQSMDRIGEVLERSGRPTSELQQSRDRYAK